MLNQNCIGKEVVIFVYVGRYINIFVIIGKLLQIGRFTYIVD